MLSSVPTEQERVKGRANKKHAISFAVRVKVEE
jgi:hypothetical protein